MLCAARYSETFEHYARMPSWTPWLLVTLVWALATAFSRVALGRHYVSDILAGICVGAAIVAVISGGTFSMDKCTAFVMPGLTGPKARGELQPTVMDMKFLVDGVREKVGLVAFQNEFLEVNPYGLAFQTYIDRINDAICPPEIFLAYGWEPEPVYRAVFNLPELPRPSFDDEDEEYDYMHFDPVNPDGDPIDSDGNIMTE